jgi:hypothetical protein
LPDYDNYEWSAGSKGTFFAVINYAAPMGGDLHMRLFTVDSNDTLIQLASSRQVGVTSQSLLHKVNKGEVLILWIYGYQHAEASYNMAVAIG